MLTPRSLTNATELLKVILLFLAQTLPNPVLVTMLEAISRDSVIACFMESSQYSRKICPTCRGQEVYRSHRRGIVERYVLRAMQIRPYRCISCDNRFYSRETAEPQIARRAV